MLLLMGVPRALTDVPAGIEPMAAAELLMDAYPDLGLVTASREPYDWCACLCRNQIFNPTSM